MRGIFAETVVEFIDRKQHWLFLLFTAVAMVIVYAAVNDKVELVENEVITHSALVQSVVNSFSIFMSAIVMLAVASIVFLIPRVAQIGRVEFYLSKPITRSTLFYGKVVSICFIYSLTILISSALVAAELIYLNVVGLNSTFNVIAIGFGIFLVWFSVTSFVGIVTRSVPMSFSAFAIIWVLQVLLKNRASWAGENEIIGNIINTLYHILPKTSEMAGISAELASGGNPADFLPIFTSLLLAVTLIYFSYSIFSRRDF